MEVPERGRPLITRTDCSRGGKAADGDGVSFMGSAFNVAAAVPAFFGSAISQRLIAEAGEDPPEPGRLAGSGASA
jgi:hypothetical protein